MSRVTHLSPSLVCGVFFFVTCALFGEPWRGAPGVSERMDAIMLRQEAELARGVKPTRIMPERIWPDRTGLPQRPGANAESRSPRTAGASAAVVVAPAIAQTVGSSFTAATLADCRSYPPDSMGAVGPAQFILAVNGRIRSFNKAAGTADGVMNVDPDVFFQSVLSLPVSTTTTTDPRIRYDRLSGRWIITIIDVPASSSVANRVLIAVSDAASNGAISGSTVWTYYFFKQDLVAPTGNTAQFADYPTLGVDVNALYIGCDMFTGSGSFVGTTGFVVRKSSILSGGPIVATAFRGLVASAGGAGPYTPQGVDNYDPAATEGYFIGTSNTDFGSLVLRRISNPGGTPAISSDINITVNTTSNPITVPHLGNTRGTNGYLDALDDRLFAAHVRGGRLWTAHNIAVNTSGVAATSGTTRRDAIRWYELNVPVGSGTPTVVQSGTIFDSTSTNPRFYWIPSVVVSGQGHAAFGSSTAGSAVRIDAATTGRLASDPLGTVLTPTRYTASATAYNPSGDTGSSDGRRWGDYSYTSVDPNDDMTMWTVQEFCDATNSYGLRVAKLLAPPPATPASGSPSSLNQGVQHASVIVTGTSASGSGFFDPGAGFPLRLAAAVSGGGVTVNSITYTDPTHFTLDLTIAPNAATGARTITVTNPDGQVAASAGGILTINPATDLAVSNSDNPDPVAAGYNLTYTIGVVNNGATAATNVTLTDAISPDVTFVSAAATQGTCSGTGPVTCSLGNLGVGGSATVTVVVKPNTGGVHPPLFTITNSATVSATEGDFDNANNTAVATTSVRADTDADGMPDDFENTYGFNSNDASDAAFDFDGDGFSNLQEFLAGTDPQQTTSALRISSVEVIGQDVRFTFFTVSGKNYRVEQSDDLANWTELPGTLVGTGGSLLFTHTGGAASGVPKSFYRAKVVP